MLRSQETAFVSFYRKSAGVLQGVLWLLQDVPKGSFEGLMVKKGEEVGMEVR